MSESVVVNSIEIIGNSLESAMTHNENIKNDACHDELALSTMHELHQTVIVKKNIANGLDQAPSAENLSKENDNDDKSTSTNSCVNVCAKEDLVVEEVQNCEEFPKEVQVGNESPKEVQIGIESPREVQNEKESLKEVYIGKESPQEALNEQGSSKEFQIEEESAKEVQNGEASPKELQNGGKSLKEIQNGELSPKVVQNDEESSREVEMAEESPKGVQKGEESPREVQMAEESPKGVAMGKESSREIQMGEETPKGVQNESKIIQRSSNGEESPRESSSNMVQNGEESPSEVQMGGEWPKVQSEEESPKEIQISEQSSKEVQNGEETSKGPDLPGNNNGESLKCSHSDGLRFKSNSPSQSPPSQHSETDTEKQLDNLLNSDSLKSEKEFPGDVDASQSKPLCYIDAVESHNDKNCIDEDNCQKLAKRDCVERHSEDKVDNKINIGTLNTSTTDTSKTTPVESDILEKEDRALLESVEQNDDINLDDDSLLLEEREETDTPMEVDQEEDISKSELEPNECKEKMLTSISLDSEILNKKKWEEGQSPKKADEMYITNVESQNGNEMEYKEERNSDMEYKEETNSDVTAIANVEIPGSSDEMLKEESETGKQEQDSVSSDSQILKETMINEEVDKSQSMSSSFLNLEKDKESESVIEDSGQKDMNSLKISEVVSCNEFNEEIDKNDATENKELTKVGDIRMMETNELSDNSVEMDDSRGDSGLNSKESKMTTEVVDFKSTEEACNDMSIAVIHSLKSGSAGSDSTVKVSFKDILKTKPEHDIVKENTQTATSIPGSLDAIVIDETETKQSSDTDKKIEKPKTLKSVSVEEESLSKDGDQTKRRLTEAGDAEVSSPKRQRLDSVIDKLGEHVGVKPSEITTVIMDSDDDCASSPLESNKTTQDEDKLDVSGNTLELSSQMLRNLIKASFKSFMKNQKLEKEQQMNDRMTKMEAATDLWRETAKHLEKSVNELTTYTKELRKRKFQSSKLKLMASRTVSVQVSLGNVSNQQNQASNQTSNRSTSLSLPPSVLRNPIGPQSGPALNRPVVSTPTSGNAVRPNFSVQSPRQQIRTGSPRGILSSPQQLSRPRLHQNSSFSHNQVIKSNITANPAIVQQTGRVGTRMTHPPPSYQESVTNMIDLTTDDDSSKQTKPSLPPSNRTSKSSAPQAAVQNCAPIRGVTSEAVLISPNNQNIRSAAPGTHDNYIANSTRPVNSSGGSVQYVNIDASTFHNNASSGSTLISTPNTSRTANSGARPGSGQAANRISNAESNSKTQGSSGTQTNSSRSLPPSVYVAQPTKHPAPLPVEPYVKAVNTTKLPPPKPSLKISRVAQGIVLSWNMPTLPPSVADIASYQLFAYQETNSAPSSSLWKKVGDVKALPLPMACTLVQFQEGNKYYFAVRAIDQFGRCGQYSDPSSIYLFPK